MHANYHKNRLKYTKHRRQQNRFAHDDGRTLWLTLDACWVGDHRMERPRENKLNEFIINCHQLTMPRQTLRPKGTISLLTGIHRSVARKRL